MKNNYYFFYVAIIFAQAFISLSTNAHCQIPCGIYDDNMRVKMMLEDGQTIEKSMKEIQTLAKKSDALSQNQLTRWVINKEKHADNIINISTDYFLTQRIKPAQKDYKERLIKHHTVILKAVTVKQSVDSDSVKVLNNAILDLLAFYPEHRH